MSAPPQQRSSSTLLWLALLPVLALTFFAFRLLNSRKDAAIPEDNRSAFNVDAVPVDEAPKRPVEYETQYERQLKQRRVADASGSGLAGFVTETDKAFRPPGPKPTDRETEKEWLKKNGHLIEKEETRLMPITRRFRKEHKVVREVDVAFGKLPRYMDIKHQYQKDRDPYKFMRGAVSLPEVRGLILKYSTNPAVWRASVGMMTEAMKQPPPKVVKEEITRFMTTDKTVSKFVGDFAEAIIPRLGKMIRETVPPGTNLGPLKDIASGLVPNAFPGGAAGARLPRQVPKRKS